MSLSYLDKRVADVVVDHLGGGVCSVATVEGEVLGLRRGVGHVDDRALHDLRVHEHAFLWRTIFK